MRSEAGAVLVYDVHETLGAVLSTSFRYIYVMQFKLFAKCRFHDAYFILIC